MVQTEIKCWNTNQWKNEERISLPEEKLYRWNDSIVLNQMVYRKHTFLQKQVFFPLCQNNEKIYSPGWILRKCQSNGVGQTVCIKRIKRKPRRLAKKLS